MKKLLIPYGVTGNGNWWMGIDIYNHSENKQVIEIIYQTPKGIQTTHTFEIYPWCHKVLGPDDINKHTDLEGRITVMLNCHDNVYVTPFMGQNDGFSILPVHQVDSLGK